MSKIKSSESPKNKSEWQKGKAELLVFPGLQVDFSDLKRTLKNLEKECSPEKREVRQTIEILEKTWLKNPRFSFAQLVLPVLKKGMTNAEFLTALESKNHAKRKRRFFVVLPRRRPPSLTARERHDLLREVRRTIEKKKQIKKPR